VTRLIDPLELAKLCWPHVTFYKEQREIIYSVRDNDETYVPAGNMLGKDFVAAFIALWFFLSRKPCRVVTTSVDGTQLQVVLWGEIKRFIQESKYPLPIVNNHCHLKKLDVQSGEECGLSYVLGRVAAKGEGMSGHHIAKTGDGIPRTLFIADEASGVDDENKKMADAWAYRVLVIGNPYPCTNFFYRGVKAGDIPSPQEPGKFYSKVIRIKATDSPNVRYALAQINGKKNGKATGKMLIPGVLTHRDYVKRRATWDEIRQCVGLDGEFHEGPGVLVFPPDWLNYAEELARKLHGQKREAKAIGIDTAMGGNSTAWSVVDEKGLIFQESMKTPNTAIIPGKTIALMREYNVPAEKVMFDAGGGGEVHVHRLRDQGYKVQAIAFGGAASPPKRRGMVSIVNRVLQDETRYVYLNRRAEMYGILRRMMEVIRDKKGDVVEGGFAIPAKYAELRRQLAPIPLLYTGEGRMYLPPKDKKPNSTEATMIDLIGCSPDEADSLVLAVFGMFHVALKRVLRVF